jgi:transposase
MQMAASSSRSVSHACRHFGISTKTFYKWKKRYEEHGDSGLCDQSRTPRNSPRATPHEVVSKILYLRQNYHFGPRKLADYLKRFHGVSVAGATVHRLLLKHGVNRLPANQKYRQHAKRWKRYEKPQPGHRLQMDVKFLERIPGTGKRLYQFTAIDDCTRIRVLKIYAACTQASAIRRGHSQTAIPHFRDSNRQRSRVSVQVSLALGGARHPARVHQAANAPAQR